MKRLLIFLGAVGLFLLPSVNSEAAEYLVQKGDCLSVIGQKTKTDWRQIARANNLKSPYLIYPGQKLSLPEEREKNHKERIKQSKKRLYTQVGANPYQGTWQWALDNFNLPEPIKQKIRQNIQEDKFKWFRLASGQQISQMVSGQGQILNQLVSQWDRAQLYAAKDYGVDGYHYLLILKCGNWAWFNQAEKRSAGKSGKPISKEPIKLAKVGLTQEPALKVELVSQEEEETSSSSFEVFDLYLGGGVYESAHYQDQADGYYLWGKARYRPFSFTSESGLETKAGLFLFGASWQGDDRGYNYQGEKIALGPTFKLLGRHWDLDLDLGFGWMWNEGSISQYQSWQKDNIFLLSAHSNFYSRRDKGEKWFAKTEANLELTLPFDSRREHSWAGESLVPDAYDNAVLELSLDQAIYDFQLKDHLRLTPGVNLGFVREFGRDDPDFLQFGPNLTLSWQNQDIVKFFAFNYKENLGGDGDQWHWFGGWISIDGLYQAYQASRIKQAEM